ncbi:ABC transporter permease [Brenneria goodwinii]|uniref:Binding-protein-dependent transport systems inner membrane component n=1 Tax=Brenneria goodwinii TaxID=1109412 RepID=A0A0G4JSX9_9GAMM|nr:ABC transporter permease [Brenneria goodwinii]MCG8156056.1 ABC transporter permease [Brenneria goodwinii]MCG8160701.1 ABC transporter permease [Brenneria goodwinii]MCG8165969.1 ABC transporter permease [Brenneria goodwinii]MCG8170457.1 ABC transporter permease [Brenneria goodwinii]MCG8175325.1 ABC transporter permease [Brenneria goodwinii]
MSRILYAFITRLAGIIAVLLILATVVFLIVRVTPGDPAAVMLGSDATPQDIAELRERLGLNAPLLQQYVSFIAKAVQGDLGQSIFLNMPVTSALAARAEPTFFLTLFSILIATIIALPVGILSAYKRGSAFDQIVVGVTMVAASIPSFWLGLILIQTMAVKLGWFPVSGYGGPDSSFFTRLHHLVLPAIALGIVNSALITRFTRAAMLDVLSDDYIRTARAKGAAEKTVILKHALKNALIPIITVIGLSIALLVSGAVVTETVFGLPGIGNLVVSAVQRRDYPVIQGALLAVAAIYVLINFIVDMLYILVDPRVRL